MSKFLLLNILGLLSLYAQPQDPIVVAGKVSFEQANDTALHITASDKAVINWKDFSIGANELTKFIQPSSASSVLNRVTTSNPSNIFGMLESNGKVLLINPNGILFGPDAVINTASFIASTLDILDGDFLAERLSFIGDEQAAVVNLGKINAWDGDVVLLGYQVDNQGKIYAQNGTVSLGAGVDILLKPSDTEKLFIHIQTSEKDPDVTGISNSGLIEALRAELKADANAYGYAINHKGQIDALGSMEIDGEVFLVAEGGLTQVSGKIRARDEIRVLGQQIGLVEEAILDTSGENGGGTILVGGDYKGSNPDILNSDYTWVGEKVQLSADALENGGGGKVILWGNDVNYFHGNITARGGSKSGNGGFVEVSSPKNLFLEGMADTSAVNGTVGKFYIDPPAVTIASNGGNDSATVSCPPNATPSTPCPIMPVPACLSGTTITYGFTGSATIDNTRLGHFLNCNDVVIDASTVPGGDGTIVVNNPVSWSFPTTLTLNAPVSITLNASITNMNNTMGNAKNCFNFTAPTIQLGDAAQTHTTAILLSAFSGNVVMNASTVLALYAGTATATSPHAQISQTDNGATPGTVQVTAGSMIFQSAINSMGANFGEAQISTQKAPVICNVTNDITFTATGGPAGITTSGIGSIQVTSTNGSLKLNGTGGSQANSFAYVQTQGGNITCNIQNDITMTAQATAAKIDVAAGAGSVSLTTNAGKLALQGGPTAGSLAFIQAQTGSVTCNIHNDISMNGGTGGLGSNAVIEVQNGANVTDISITSVAGALTMMGGITGNTANINTMGTGAITIDIFGDITLDGTSGGIPAISPTTGNLSLTSHQGNIAFTNSQIVTQGSLTVSTLSALGGKGQISIIDNGSIRQNMNPHLLQINAASDVRLLGQVGGVMPVGSPQCEISAAGPINLTTGGALNLNAGSWDTSTFITAQQLCTIVANNDITLNAGTQGSAEIVSTAGAGITISHSGSGTTNLHLIGATAGTSTGADITTNNGGNLNININGDFNLTGGNSSSMAVVGIFGAFMMGTSTVTLSGANFNLTGGTANSAMINGALIETGLPAAFGGGGNGNIQITATGNIILNGGMGNNSFTYIGTNGSGVMNNNIQISAANLQLNSTSGVATNAGAFIQTGGSNLAGGAISITTSGSVSMNGNGVNPATIQMGPMSTGDMTIIAGTNISLNSPDNISVLSGGNMFLVVDNASPFNIPPHIGSGTFTVSSGGTISTTGGALRIFSSTLPQTTILGTLNGMTFTPPANLIFPQWFSTFAGGGGAPFTVYLKSLFPIPPNLPTSLLPLIFSSRAYLAEFSPAIAEAFREWEIQFDYNRFSYIDYMVNYNQKLFNEKFPSRRNTSSYDVIPSFVNKSVREEYRDYHLLKLDQL